jgi:centromeric protein E
VRDSKLTRILSESLLGSGRIRLIICASPSTAAMNETSSTLQFADRVKKAIFERPMTHSI